MRRGRGRVEPELAPLVRTEGAVGALEAMSMVGVGRRESWLGAWTKGVPPRVPPSPSIGPTRGPDSITIICDYVWKTPMPNCMPLPYPAAIHTQLPEERTWGSPHAPCWNFESFDMGEARVCGGQIGLKKGGSEETVGDRDRRSE
jgi:hypothetical protein